MTKKLIFGLICILILVLPAYAGDDEKPCEKKGCDKALCDKQASEHQCSGCDKEEVCKHPCCDKDGKCACCGKDCKDCECACCKEKCDGKCKDKNCTCCKGKCDGKCKDKECKCEKEESEESEDSYEEEDDENDDDESSEEMGEMGKMQVMVMMSCEEMMGPQMHKMMMQMANPLDRKAKAFIKGKVKTIAIMPFSDYSATSPMGTSSNRIWAARRIHDYMSAEFLEMGKLVIPYDTMIYAFTEIKRTQPGKATELSGLPFLGQQMTAMMISPEYQMEVLKEVGKGGAAMGAPQMGMISFTPEEIKALGQKLGVQAVFTGEISDYGSLKHLKADARTFIPPFLGVWNPSVLSMCRMMVHLYDTETGELIWSSLEEVKREPNFPLFSSEDMNYDRINKKLAKQIVDHFREQMMPMMEEKVPSSGGPGTTRREKNVHIIVKEKS